MAEKKKITGDMPLAEVLKQYPETIDVFTKYGFHCIGCAMASFETIEQAASAHGIDVNKLVEDLNKAIKKK